MVPLSINSSHRNCSRHGVTLVELMLVIGVLGLLVCLLVPAIVNSRNQASRIACQNQLRQVGLALQNFEASQRKYPNCFYGVVNRPPEVYALWTVSPTAQLAGYLGDSNAAHLVEAARKPDLWDLRKMTLPAPRVVQCPADPLATGTAVSYRYNRGTTPIHPGDSLGVFTGFVGRTAAEITDGLSYTVFAAERLIAGGVADKRRDPLLVTAGTTASIGMECISLNRQGGSRGAAPYLWGTRWLLSELGHSAYYHFLAPNTDWQDCSSKTLVPEAVSSARSLHTQGVNVVYGDGHVQLVNDRIDLDVWRAMGTRNASDRVN